MKKLLLIVTASIFLCSNLYSQQLEVNWSEELEFNNSKEGFFDEFVGGNSKYIYGMLEKSGLGGNKRHSEVIMAFDKKTMKKVASRRIVDVKDSKTVQKYKDLYFFRTVVFENVIYCFWMKENKNKDELFVQSFTAELKPLNALKKIYELTGDPKASRKQEIFLMSNKKLDEKLLIGGELASQKGQNIKVELKLLNNDFSFSSAHQVALPLIATGSSNALSSTYLLGDDGNLHIKSYVTMTKEERKAAKKGESTSYPIYSVVNVQSGQIKSYTMKFENKNIYNFSFKIEKNAIKVFGFFCDLIKDPRGNDTHGIFYGILDPKTFNVNDMNFSYFTKAHLDEVFAKDKEDRSDKKRLKTKQKAQSEDESIASNYEIEQVQSLDEKNLVLFCSRMYNYSRTYCDSKGNCRTTYYCQKDNVTAFKISQDGSIVWAANLDRKITYNGTDIYDLRVINQNNKFYVAYGSDYQTTAEKKNRKSKKSRRYKSDRFEYAVFDYETGKYSKHEYKVNAINGKKSEKKSISAIEIEVIDNQFYTNSIRNQYKIGTCISFILCPPLGYFFVLSGNAMKGEGYLGKIVPIQ